MCFLAVVGLRSPLSSRLLARGFQGRGASCSQAPLQHDSDFVEATRRNRLQSAGVEAYRK